MSLYSEIKKYLLFLVGFFCLLLAAHIVFLYLYHDAETYPLPGGTINIGMMGDKPSLNALNFDTKIENDPNDTVLRFIYRGLIRFSLTDKKIVGDLGLCDIESFPAVRCTLNKNAVWSDGTNMTHEDVLATYAFFRENATNEYTKSQLGLVEITEADGALLFRFKTRDVTAIQSLFIPIIRKKDIPAGWNWAINENLSFSGPYVYSVKEVEDTIFLGRNPFYIHTNRPFYFDQVRFGFGKTNDDIYDVINPDILLSDNTFDIKKEQIQKYIRPVFYGAFMNAGTLPAQLRKTLFYDILGTLDIKDEGIMSEENIFFGDIPNAPRNSSEDAFFQTVFSLGYSFGGTFQAPENKPQPIVKKTLQYITSPGNVTPLFVPSTTIEVRWTAPVGTTKIIVNDYTLRNFVARNRTFTYTAKKEFGNLVTGQNIYRVSFYNGNKLLAEEPVIIYHSPVESELTKMWSDWEKANTPASAPVVSVPKNLDPKKLYNRDGKILSFRIVVQSWSPYLARIAEQTEQKLSEFGTEVHVQEMSLADIKKNLSDPNFWYDIIFTGVHVGLFHYNVSPFLHSNNIKTGFNITRFRDTNLDTLLVRLTDRLYYNVPDRLRDIELGIQKILERESLIFTLGSPYEYIQAKNSVLGLKIPEFMTGREMLVDFLSRGYFKEWFKRSPETKTVFWFFEWLKNALLPTT